MKFKTKIYTAIACILLFNQVSFADCNNIAVVDLQTVVNNSKEVQQLKTEHDKQLDELNQIIKKAQCEIAKENDLKKVVDLQDKYTNEFNCKKSEIDKTYSNKLSNIEQKIKNKIEEKAKCDGYEFVFAKSVALYGGKDITDDISCLLNK